MVRLEDVDVELWCRYDAAREVLAAVVVVVVVDVAKKARRRVA